MVRSEVFLQEEVPFGVGIPSTLLKVSLGQGKGGRGLGGQSILPVPGGFSAVIFSFEKKEP